MAADPYAPTVEYGVTLDGEHIGDYVTWLGGQVGAEITGYSLDASYFTLQNWVATNGKANPNTGLLGDHPSIDAQLSLFGGYDGFFYVLNHFLDYSAYGWTVGADGAWQKIPAGTPLPAPAQDLLSQFLHKAGFQADVAAAAQDLDFAEQARLSGEIATGGWAMVGEQGPELVNLPAGSQVVPNNVLGGGGPGFTGFAEGTRGAALPSTRIIIHLDDQMAGSVTVPGSIGNVRVVQE